MQIASCHLSAKVDGDMMIHAHVNHSPPPPQQQQQVTQHYNCSSVTAVRQPMKHSPAVVLY
jgi:hypothetical protein